MMRMISTFPSSVLSHRRWLLVFTISLMVLGAWWSQPYYYYYNIHGNSDTNNNNNVEELSISMRIPSKGAGDPPVLAYWILGSKGESKKIMRLLKAIYHPRNQYLLQLDAAASYYERRKLALSVQSERAFRAFGNVNVVGTSYAFNHMGASALAATLHASSLLLKISAVWDWFITLTASDYPLMTQDDILHAFSFLPRDLNFVNYTSNIAWKKQHNIDQIVVDPSLYNKKNSPILYATETRETPDAFKIFGAGSPWVILSRALMEHCVEGWDNIPRKLLMYFSNVAFPLESYFQTVICNSPQYQNTTVTNDLRYNIIHWDTNTRGSEPLVLNLNMLHDEMVTSEAAFATPFKEGDDAVLQELDKNVLNRKPGGLVTGEWCINHGMNLSAHTSKAQQQDLCFTYGDINTVKPGLRGKKFGIFLSKLVAQRRLFAANPCHTNETIEEN